MTDTQPEPKPQVDPYMRAILQTSRIETNFRALAAEAEDLAKRIRMAWSSAHYTATDGTSERTTPAQQDTARHMATPYVDALEPLSVILHGAAGVWDETTRRLVAESEQEVQEVAGDGEYVSPFKMVGHDGPCHPLKLHGGES